MSSSILSFDGAAEIGENELKLNNDDKFEEGAAGGAGGCGGDGAGGAGGVPGG